MSILSSQVARSHSRLRHVLARTAHRGGDEQAQGVVEFAFILMILCLLFVGTIDFARFLYYRDAIQSAARTGAEMAGNHCFYAGNCEDPNTLATATSDTWVMWSTYCEAKNYVQLQPSFSSCTPPVATPGSAAWTPTCSTSSCTACSTDICVSPSTRSTWDTVTVSVGYNFHPYSFLLDWLFTNQSCYTGDSATNGHTLCASATGRVSG